MFIFRTLNFISQNPNISNPFSHRNCFRVSLPPNRLSHCFFIRSSMASSKIVAEYAKSNRSTCKKCAEIISSKTLRLGLVNKDPRGFEATKWHHLNCFPMDSQPIESVENIDGFSSLESSDQEVLKNLKAECPLLPKEEEQDEIEGDDEKNSKESKVRKADEVAVDDHKGSNSKKLKVSKADEAAKNELEGSNSKKPKASTKIVAEYAKSSRSSCKKCTEPISAKTLRLGFVSRDPRGFDAAKWHHLNCFPLDSQPIVSVDIIDGFSSLENNDQEMLKNLIAGCDHMPKEDEMEVGDGKSSKESEVSKEDEVALDKPEGNNSKKPKVRKADEVAVNELEGSTSKKPKASTKIVAEYAKSSRSTCKKCAEPISAKTLRLGLVSRDPRGFDATKWHHLNCFPIDSQPIVSVENVDGFSSLESNDQEALKNLTAGCEFSPKEDGIEGSDEENSKESKVPKANEVSGDELEGSIAEKPEESKLELVFSVSDVKDKYKDASLLPKWKAFQSIIFLERDEGLHDSAKIAAFDFDGCLVNTSVRRIGAYAWSLLYPSIPEKLKSLYDDGYKLVIFTNEANIERWKNKRQVAVDSKIGRLNNFIDLVKVPMQVFIACGIGKTDGQTEDPFRKPKAGMWRIMEQQFNSGIKIDMDQSFYVGDAAGRGNDHSDADIGFAKAIGLKFYVPEDYFSA